MDKHECGGAVVSDRSRYVWSGPWTGPVSGIVLVAATPLSTVHYCPLSTRIQTATFEHNGSVLPANLSRSTVPSPPSSLGRVL